MAPFSFFLTYYASVVVFLICCSLHVLNLHFVMLQGFQRNFKNRPLKKSSRSFTSHAELNAHRRPRRLCAREWGCGEREWGDWLQLCRNASGAAQHPCADFFLASKENFPSCKWRLWSDSEGGLHHVWRDCAYSQANSASRTAGPSGTGIRCFWHFQLPQSSSSHQRWPQIFLRLTCGA